MTLDERDTVACGFPPHPGHDDGDRPAKPWQPGPSKPSAWSRYRRWVRRVPETAIPVTAAPLIWTAAEVMHAASVDWMGPGVVTVVAASAAYARASRKAARSAHPELDGAELAAAIGVPLAWMTAATKIGPLWGPFDLMTTVFFAGAGTVGYWWLRSREAIKHVRQRRADAITEAKRLAAEQAIWEGKKTEWHRVAPKLGLQGSDLVEVTENENDSETWHIDLYQTKRGLLASDVNFRRVAAQLSGEKLMVTGGWPVPMNRVDVEPHPEMAYRLLITFRRADLWKAGTDQGLLLHPMISGQLAESDPLASWFGENPSIMDPICFGRNPETGKPLLITLYDEEIGAHRVLVLGASGSGKSMVLDIIRERITACSDAILIQINMSKGAEDSWWEALSAASALAGKHGEKAHERALEILDFVWTVSNTGRPRRPGYRNHVPTPGEPAMVLMIDEVDQTANDGDRQVQLGQITSKCRSEGIILILGSQRPQDAYVGGGMVRGNLSDLIWGALRANDRRQAGNGYGEYELPDMGEYGTGQPGVFGVTTLPLTSGSVINKGRAFFWGRPSTGMIEIINQRAASRGRPYQQVEPGLGYVAARWKQITGTATEADRAAVKAELARKGDENRYDLRVLADGSTAPAGSQTQDKLDEVANLLLDGGRTQAPSPAPPGPGPRNGSQAAPSAPSDPAPPASGSLPGPERQALWELLGRPGGVSARGAAQMIERSNPLPGRDSWSYEPIRAVLLEWEGQKLVTREGAHSTTRWHRADKPGRHLQAVPDPQTGVSEDAAALDDTGAEAVTGHMMADGEVAVSEAVMMAASWGLRCSSMEEARDLALRTGMPEDQVEEAIELLESDRGYVAEHVRDVLQAAKPGAPLPDWVTSNLPAGAAS